MSDKLKVCKEPGCESKLDVKGYCKKHYTKLMRTGRTTLRTTLERLLAKSEYITESGCLIWLGSTNNDGYGRMRTNSIKHGTHRLMWEAKNGPIPDGLCVLHRCDVPSCININHLFLGTHKDNVQDAIKKGRMNHLFLPTRRKGYRRTP